MKAVLLWFAALLLAFVLSASNLLDKWHSWQHWVDHAQAAERTRLQHQAVLDYVLSVQHTCGPEAWWLPRRDGARVCTDKHSRPTDQLLAGANP